MFIALTDVDSIDSMNSSYASHEQARSDAGAVQTAATEHGDLAVRIAAVQAFAERVSLEKENLDEAAAELIDRLYWEIVRSGQTASWDDAVGPVYRTDTVAKLLGVSKQAVSQRAERLSLLRLKTSDGFAIYPVFQFGEDGQPVRGLRMVLRCLASGVDDPFTWAIWLNSPAGQGGTFAELLKQGRARDVVAQAKADASAWSN
jgi:hypothetical protein